ncbi:MAG: DEAD/DEAH box helicase [Chloroflexota bacterium]|nr:DEAD/DEAH box helicase [Chloroflexota bacterium]
MNSSYGELAQFHPLIAKWFTNRIGSPTDIQLQSWPIIAAQENALIMAPTGSGKTLTAFLWAIDRLITGATPTGHTSILYVSPLKALNNDIQRNLLGPLGELRLVFKNAGEPYPNIRVQTRSGDTPQSDRQRMQRQPPEILITTPESLNLLLSSHGGRSMLTNISTVILDEIHSVVGTKRGVHLITAVERMVLLSGEFQRIALSATIRPLDIIAAFVGGYRPDGNHRNPHYISRPVSIIQSNNAKQYALMVKSPEESEKLGSPDSIWEPLVKEFKKTIENNHSTLLFVNSRRLSEKISLMINNEEANSVAYAHHGSLSREIRSVVEARLKSGDLKAIVATNSLELGIDIGALEEVILVQSPSSVSSAIQRIGRAGHNVGEASRGTLYPTHPIDLLQAAVLASAITEQDIEGTKPIQGALDVLAQVIVSMVGVQTWDMDALYAQLKTSYPYKDLTRQQFDLVLHMLEGRYSDSRIRELKPRISVDHVDKTITARKGALLALYTSGGMIPDRGYYHLRLLETNTIIGDLDEEFVWEASIGQTFTLGTQNWKIERITHNDVIVTPAPPKALAAPFWRSEENDRDFHFSHLISEFLENAEHHLEDSEFPSSLHLQYHMDSAAADQLISFLKKQKAASGSSLPHRHHILIECCSTGPDIAPGNQVILHTFWGGRVNRPFSMALHSAWQERFGHKIEVFPSDDCVVLLLPHYISGEELLSLVTSTNIERLLRKRLESSGFFGARFRECAGRALLITRHNMNERMPLWMNRLHSQKLMDSVMQYEDFPILLETWRACLQDEFDLDNLNQVLTELENGIISWSITHTKAPSPMAQSVSWNQIVQYMYMNDEPSSDKISRLHKDLLHDVVFNPGLRPTVHPEVIGKFERKRLRLCPGYSPETSRDLLDWVRERLLVPHSEWQNLLTVIQNDHNVDKTTIIEPIKDKLVQIILPGANALLIAAVEIVPHLIRGLHSEPGDISILTLLDGQPVHVKCSPNSEDREDEEILTWILGEWLQFYGPKTIEFITETLGLPREIVQGAFEDLIDSQKLITGLLITDCPDEQICDGENFEILLRMSRAGSIPSFEPLNINALPLFLASIHGITHTEADIETLFKRIEQLLCYPAAAEMWEAEIFPARLHHYNQSWLDTLMQEGDLRWIGNENRNIYFCFESELDLITASPEMPLHTEDSLHSDDTAKLFIDPRGRYDFSTLLQSSGFTADELSDRLWEAVWQGSITNDTFSALRRAVENQFKVPKIVPTKQRGRTKGYRSGDRTSFSRWKGLLPSAGNWFLLSKPDLEDDLLQTEELNKNRVRLLLDRYGILFRELLEKESTAFRWSSIFRSLRLMELSGEVLSGYFFKDIQGPQFISPQAFHQLRQRLPDNRIYWINAADPISLCGVKIDALKRTLPKRASTTHLVYAGTDIVMMSKRQGKELIFNTAPNDHRLQQYLGPLQHLLHRSFQPIRRITIETINGEEAAYSPYVDALRSSFEVMFDIKKVVLYRRIG